MQDAEIDIIAVTGLGGHALGSFRAPEGTSVWLRDFAPEDIPGAGFITYGYHSAVVASDSNQGVRELARTLLDELAGFCSRTQTQERPICFIAHSLGGVVLKEALIIASQATEPVYRDLYDVMLATPGLILMGVPNLGLRHNQLATVVAGQPNENFVRDLLTRPDGEPSQFLSHLTTEFALLCKQNQPSWKIISYYETGHSRTIAVGSHASMLYSCAAC